MFISWKRR